MAKPYSLDLRERVVAAVEEGGLSRRRAAAQFGVGISTVIGWVRRLRDGKNSCPGPHFMRVFLRSLTSVGCIKSAG